MLHESYYIYFVSGDVEFVKLMFYMNENIEFRRFLKEKNDLITDNNQIVEV